MERDSKECIYREIVRTGKKEKEDNKNEIRGIVNCKILFH